MDNNLLESDDDNIEYDCEFIDNSPFPGICQNEAVGIDLLSKCFEQRYNACPVLFMGSLRDACQAAISPTIIQERRPVLIYLHNDDSLFNKTFCKDILCSTEIIDYLLENYIVWLLKFWEEIFYTKFFDDLSIEQYPLLIGIMRLFEDKTNELIISEYQFKSLIEGNMLIRTQKTINRKMLLNKLCIFKKQCDENEQDLAFDFVRRTGLCWEIILEIAKYLSLNDAISTFSTDILRLLNKDQGKFQLSNPCPPFTRMILQKFKSEQIVSLQLNANRYWLKTDLIIFNNIISMTLLNLPYEYKINQYEEYFPKLTCLSLCYDNEINFNMFYRIFNQIWKQIKRFEIRCAGTICTHYDINQLDKSYWLKINVE
ncbi:unnamed protein product [Rotaria sp. Silwood2]|nr:unnamed protein product [Rotaria sp. Silwood2]